jgi:O-antigen ligase
MLLLAFVASLHISIAAANILLSATALGWIVMMVRDRARLAAPAFFLPLVIYAVATLISSAFSSDRVTSFVDDKQLVLFAIVPLVYSIARGRRASLVVDVIVSVGAASAAYGIIQYTVLHYDNLGRRPEGALTHYMTYSGILMLVICAAVARVVFGARDRTWPALVLPALIVALVLTFTRSAWVGAAVAVGLLLTLRDFRLTALLPIVLAAAFVLSPHAITTRMTTMFSTKDPSNQDRLAMMEIGSKMIADHPLTGVGPNMVERVYPQYREATAVQKNQPHLHNVPLQIAAERGLPALAIWVWFIVTLTRDVLRKCRSSSLPSIPTAALAAIGAMLAAGMFEYNFGDSEFLMLFLVIVTLPYAADRVVLPAAPAVAEEQRAA